MALTDKEKRLLALTLLGEAGGEGRKGMEAVMHVIMNRANSGRYPSNPAAVAVQGNGSGYHQFSTWNSTAKGGNHPEKKYSVDSQAFKTALQVVTEVAMGQSTDPTYGATHYYAPGSVGKPRWFDAEAPAGAVSIGKHVFGARVPPTPARKQTSLEARDERAATAKPSDYVTGEGLNVRTVKTVPIDPLTGMPAKAPIRVASIQNMNLAPGAGQTQYGAPGWMHPVVKLLDAAPPQNFVRPEGPVGGLLRPNGTAKQVLLGVSKGASWAKYQNALNPPKDFFSSFGDIVSDAAGALSGAVDAVGNVASGAVKQVGTVANKATKAVSDTVKTYGPLAKLLMPATGGTLGERNAGLVGLAASYGQSHAGLTGAADNPEAAPEGYVYVSDPTNPGARPHLVKLGA